MKSFLGATLLTAIFALGSAFTPQVIDAQPKKITAEGDGVQVAQKDKAPEPKRFGKGLIIPKDIKERHAKSWARHKHVLKALPSATVDKFDCREMGWMPAFDDQGQCGDCWVFSGADPIAAACIKAGYGKNITISKQQLLDCHFQDACGGGWPEDVAKVAKQYGVVTDEVYGKQYNANPGSCKSFDKSKLIMLSDYGFVGESDGVPDFDAFCDCMVKFGVISVCYDASGTPDSGEDGPVWNGNGGRSVDHAIKAIAFDRTKKAILCWNQWYNGKQDLFWCKWGANQMGTSAMWVSMTPLPPPPPPVCPTGQHWDATLNKCVDDTPTPPGPTPPNPLSPTAYTIDPIKLTIDAGANWTLSGGKLGEAVIDLSKLSPAQAAAIKELYNDLLKQKADIPKQMPAKFPTCPCKTDCICYGTCKCKDLNAKCPCDNCPMKKPVGILNNNWLDSIQERWFFPEPPKTSWLHRREFFTRS